MIFGERVMVFGAGIPGMPGANVSNGDGGGNAVNADGGDTVTGYGTETSAPSSNAGNNNEESQQQPGLADMTPMLLIWGAVFVGMWFLMIRPQRKREKKMRELQAAISTGDNIVTSGGLFGKIADVGEDCFIVEFGTNRGVRISVLKADVVAVRTPQMTPSASDSE